MKMRLCLLSLLVTVLPLGLRAQNNVGPQLSDSLVPITVELSQISKSVQMLNDRFKTFFDKLGGSTVNDRQQKVITGIQSLTAAEQRVTNFQNSQYDLTQKLNDTRSKLIQIESDLRPRNIDRSVAMVGTTETEELRESRRQRLQGEKLTLTQLAIQLQNDISENTNLLREAQTLAARLRKMYIPMIEREMYDQ